MLSYFFICRINEFKKEHRKICQILGSWNLKTREPSTSQPIHQVINLDQSTSDSSQKSSDDSAGISHFLIQSRLDCELFDQEKDTSISQINKVVLETPNTSVIIDKLLPNLPSREVIRQSLGYGPLEMKIPDPVTYEVLRRPSNGRKEGGDKKTIFTIINPPGLPELSEVRFFDHLFHF